MAISIFKKSGLFKKTRVEQFPFSVDLGGELKITCPAYSQISFKEGVMWRQIYNGSQWTTNGIFLTPDTISLACPMNSLLKLSLEGESWFISNTTKGRTQFKFKIDKYLTYSGAFHFVTFIFLMVAVSISNNGAELTFTERLRNERIAQLVNLSSGAGNRYVPYGGSSFRDFLKRLEERLSPDDKLKNLVGSISKLKFNHSAVNENSSDFIGSAKGLLDKFFKGGQSYELSSGIEQSQFVFKDEDKKVQSRLTPEDQAHIKLLFDGVREDMRRSYNMILMSEPGFTVAVEFSVEVRSNGHLSIIKFSPNGTFTKESIEKLKHEMSKSLFDKKLESRLSGTVIKGENIFIKN